MLRLMSRAALAGTPDTVPSSSTPRKMLPPWRFANEQTVSKKSRSGLLPQRLHSVDMSSPALRWALSSR